MSTTVKVGADDYHPGVYFESSRGWRATAMVPRLAASAGVMELTSHDHRTLRLFEADRVGLDVLEHVKDLAETAEEALNDETEDGFYWGWEEGEFGLWAERIEGRVDID